jgi:uncharacterized SAM-binding protein YcdF (DUF218 family)
VLIQLLTPSPLLSLAFLIALTVWAWRMPRTLLLARGRHVLAVLSLWGWLCCTPAVTNAIITELEGPFPADGALPSTPPAPGTSVIVLGSGQMSTPNGTPAPRLDENGWERLHEGVRLWRHTGGTLIVTGGPGGDDQPTIARTMGRMAVELGVPPDQVALAFNSRTTYQDLVSAKPLLKGGPVWLVTSAIHMPRSLAVARQIGIPAQPHPTDYRQIRDVTWRAWIPDNGAPVRMNAALHELIGRLYYRWKGWAS